MRFGILGPLKARADDGTARAAARLREALALWRGPAPAALPGTHPEVTRLTELRPAAVRRGRRRHPAPGPARAADERRRGDHPRRPGTDHAGRVALLGDAGYGATMGGMGTGVAIVGAHVLAGELALAGGDHRVAFAAYERRIGGFARGCQRISGNAGPFFAPPTERRIRSRDRRYRLLASRPMAGFFRRLTEKAATAIKLPDYPA
ncbi:hypothetical protein TU94_23535 [Streptomyces cyaneogriseus subsp. noncyanogenus]|uniref:Bacterial transcriptional activator domain-containing protein n=1 Tax=Streptomyces cyaneogriseus subsp. noncyanogenus TaxID=477245 RepID=A0A0C5G6Y7_9ACTN|nr:hypothetical protein TU94_23535 [Streptomyces cyaneogriseus subsp. noncyanogenus]